MRPPTRGGLDAQPQVERGQLFQQLELQADAEQRLAGFIVQLAADAAPFFLFDPHHVIEPLSSHEPSRACEQIMRSGNCQMSLRPREQPLAAGSAGNSHRRSQLSGQCGFLS